MYSNLQDKSQPPSRGSGVSALDFQTLILSSIPVEVSLSLQPESLMLMDKNHPFSQNHPFFSIYHRGTKQWRSYGRAR